MPGGLQCRPERDGRTHTHTPCQPTEWQRHPPRLYALLIYLRVPACACTAKPTQTARPTHAEAVQCATAAVNARAHTLTAAFAGNGMRPRLARGGGAGEMPTPLFQADKPRT